MSTIDSTATEEPTTDVAPVPMPKDLAVVEVVTAGDLVARLDTIRDAMNRAMVEGVDYGRIPGTDKPTLLKPGAEKLGVMFKLDVQIVNDKTWGPGDHLTVSSRATVFHAPTGQRLGYGEGLCSTREKKYAYRQAGRTCPDCGATAIIKGKAEYGGGWLCWGKKGGCGAKFHDGDQAIESQEVVQVDNPDLPDLWNVAVKMGEKRARVDAILAVTGASALFTQDAEDLDEPPPPQQPKQHAPPPSPGKITQPQVDGMLEDFKAMGSPGDLLDQILDGVSAPAGAHAGERIAKLDAAQALRVQKALSVERQNRENPTQFPIAQDPA